MYGDGTTKDNEGKSYRDNIAMHKLWWCACKIIKIFQKVLLPPGNSHDLKNQVLNKASCNDERKVFFTNQLLVIVWVVASISLNDTFFEQNPSHKEQQTNHVIETTLVECSLKFSKTLLVLKHSYMFYNR